MASLADRDRFIQFCKDFSDRALAVAPKDVESKHFNTNLRRYVRSAIKAAFWSFNSIAADRLRSSSIPAIENYHRYAVQKAADGFAENLLVLNHPLTVRRNLPMRGLNATSREFARAADLTSLVRVIDAGLNDEAFLINQSADEVDAFYRRWNAMMRKDGIKGP